MSRTDGHEPAWVRARRYGYVDHDHSDGVCQVVDYGERPMKRFHRSCRKWVLETLWCPHLKRYKEVTDLSLFGEGEGFSTAWRIPSPAGSRRRERYCQEGGGSHPYQEWVRHEEIPCICDEGPVRRWPHPSHPCRWELSPQDWEATYYSEVEVDHRPERRRLRDELQRVKAAWNGGFPSGEEAWEDAYGCESSPRLPQHWKW